VDAYDYHHHHLALLPGDPLHTNNKKYLPFSTLFSHRGFRWCETEDIKGRRRRRRRRRRRGRRRRMAGGGGQYFLHTFIIIIRREKGNP